MTAEQHRPTRPANRRDDMTCGIPGCPCPHNPARGQYPNGPCDRGWTVPGPNATTGGTRGAGGVQVTPGVIAENAVRRCPACKSHAESLRKDHA
jgi:hypothetical protein